MSAEFREDADEYVKGAHPYRGAYAQDEAAKAQPGGHGPHARRASSIHTDLRTQRVPRGAGTRDGLRSRGRARRMRTQRA